MLLIYVTLFLCLPESHAIMIRLFAVPASSHNLLFFRLRLSANAFRSHNGLVLSGIRSWPLHILTFPLSASSCFFYCCNDIFHSHIELRSPSFVRVGMSTDSFWPRKFYRGLSPQIAARCLFFVAARISSRDISYKSLHFTRFYKRRDQLWSLSVTTQK